MKQASTSILGLRGLMLTLYTENRTWSIWQKRPCKTMSLEEVKKFEVEGQYSLRLFVLNTNPILRCRKPCSIRPSRGQISAMARASGTKACRDRTRLQLLQEDDISMDATGREGREYRWPISGTSREGEGCRTSCICSSHSSQGLGRPRSAYGPPIEGSRYLGAAHPSCW
jgi:hypothetical protein